jgi:hypothetical protein
MGMPFPPRTDNFREAKSAFRTSAVAYTSSSTETLAMPNDAKLGLIAGVALVIAVAVIYFHNDLTAAKTPGDAAAATVVGPTAAPPTPGRSTSRPVKGKTMAGMTQGETAATTSQMLKAPEEAVAPEGDIPQP